LPDSFLAIPWRHRLSTRVLAVAAAISLLGVLALVAVEWRLRADLTAQAARQAELLARAIQTSAEEAMLDAGKGHAYAAAARAGSLPGIAWIQVIDKAGKVAFSTGGREAGTALPKESRACGGCHAAGGTRSVASLEARTEVEAGPHGRVLTVVAPFHNDRSCTTAACHVHPPGRQVLGLLAVGVRLDPLDRDVVAYRAGFGALLAAGAIALGAALYLLGRAEVLEPVAALVEGTHRVARDDLDVEIRVHSRGELGLLAGSFNQMTRSLRRLEDELTGLMSGLEAQVEARTRDLKEAQARLARTERLSALGRLSASIAHEINNPLAGILTSAKLVSRVLAEGVPDEAARERLRRSLSLVEREAQRCSAIVKDLLDFARERPPPTEEVDPVEVVEEALSLLEEPARLARVRIVRDLAPAPPVVADFGQLRQAFLNVVQNAVEALDGRGGTLAVSSRVTDGVVEVAFADDGPGIPADALGHVFDPFFTTKERGTGLGLSVVYGVLERHGGSVHAENRPGGGAAFTLRLPLAREAAA
jgi:two-component system NtrC family sensor kinase